MNSIKLFCLVALIASADLALAADAPPALVKSAAPDWPQWRGPRRDGVSDEKGLLPSWPEGGPKQLWAISGLGHGYSSPIVVGDSIYITGDKDSDLLITALKADGERRWQVKNGRAWNGPYPGARAACCFADDKLYHMNAHGRLACLDAASGKEAWAVETLARFQGSNIMWGISEAVLVDGGHVFATPAGKGGLMVALDAKTGNTVWTTPAVDGEKASYASAILLAHGGRRMLVNCGSQHAFAVDAESGKLLWKVPHVDTKVTVTSIPVFCAGRLFFTNASRSGGGVFGLQLDGAKAWSKELTVSHGGLVAAQDRLCGTSGRGVVKGWVAIDPATGDATQLAELPIGSLAYADQRFYCLSERGTITLQELTTEGFKSHGRFVVAAGKDVWAHPVICKGRLYLRFDDTLYCYDIQAH